MEYSGGGGGVTLYYCIAADVAAIYSDSVDACRNTTSMGNMSPPPLLFERRTSALVKDIFHGTSFLVTSS